MTIARITPPGSEPLSLDEIKDHLRIDHAHEDVLIADLLSAARQHAEHLCGQKIIMLVWRQYESSFPCDFTVPLRVAPVRSVDFVTAFDAQGQPNLVDGSLFELVRGTEPALIKFDREFDRTRAFNGLEVDVTAGMGELGVDIDDAIKRAILLLIAHWYEFRGLVTPQQQPVSIPPGVDVLLSAYRTMKL